MKQKANSTENVYKVQLQEIGTILKTARETRQLYLEDIADEILIRGSLLNAIEAGELESLPEPVYVRGLIRRYADALGLDGETLASQFFEPVTRGRRRTSWKDSPAAQLRPLHLYAAYVLLMVAAVSGLSLVLRQTAPEATALPPLDPLALNPEQGSPSPSEPGTILSTEAPTPDTQGTDHPIRVETTLTAQSWLRIIADGQTQFEGILKEGENRVWTADQQLTIRAGNAGGVVVSYNEGQAKSLGRPGMVAEVTYASNQTVGLAF